MSIDIAYTGQLASTAGAADESIELEAGATLGSLVSLLAGRHGGEFASLLCEESGRVRPIILVAIDGAQATGDREARSLDGVREVMFMAPIAGG